MDLGLSGRAAIVTGGGGHDNKFVVLTDRFMMSLPFARAMNPITHTNWEEVGVEPDIPVMTTSLGGGGQRTKGQ